MEFTTFEAAYDAWVTAIEDATGDAGIEADSDTIAWELARYSIAPLCKPAVRKEFLRITIGVEE